MSTTDTSASDAHRARAISKLHLELDKDIGVAIHVAETCALWEILRFCYLCRISRVFRLVPEYRGVLTYANVVEMQLRDDAMKYAISLAAKHGDWRNKTSAIHTFTGFDNDRVIQLERVARHINAKFETEVLLNVAEVRVVGERDQECIVDMTAGIRDPKRAMYLNYGYRLEQFTLKKKEKMSSGEELVARLRQEYTDVADLFEADSGISLEAYCEGTLDLLRLLRERGEDQERKAAFTAQGRVDIEAKQTFIAVAQGMYFTDAHLAGALSPEFMSYMRRNSFDGTKFDDSELRFHYLTRRPFLFGAGFAILSPDLIFDSLFDNVHFSLLESNEAKNKYKERRAAQFVNEIARVAAKAGYLEIERDVDLTKGKQKLGDIDLVLRNDATGHTLLVEAKNHALPLPVYFRSPQALDAHIATTRDWERKVQRRTEHVRGDSASYAVSGAWDYLIVSNMPEPLSHVSPVLVLCLQEFANWVVQRERQACFNDFFQAFYKPESANMSMDEMQYLLNEGYTLVRPAPDQGETV